MHEDYIATYLDEIQDIAINIDRTAIAKAVDILFEAWQKGNHVYVAGCGGSAGTASHFAADLAKTTMSKNKKRIKAISLVENPSLITAWINDEGWDNVFVGQIENFIKRGDVIVCFSVHGGKGRGNALAWSQNLTKAMQFVKDKGGKAIGIAGFDGGAFTELADACIIVPKNSTPLVEGFHGDIHHLIIFRLKELIQDYDEHIHGKEALVERLKELVNEYGEDGQWHV
ncbi:MAG: SIS domain-containing protein [archaeon]